MKISQLVAFQAVRIGQEVANCFNDKEFDISFRDPFFRITRRSNGDSVLVPIHNVPYLRAEDGEEEAKAKTPKSRAANKVSA